MSGISLKRQNELRKKKELQRKQSPEFIEKLRAVHANHYKKKRIETAFKTAHDKRAVAEIKIAKRRSEMTDWERGLLEAQKYARRQVVLNLTVIG